MTDHVYAPGELEQLKKSVKLCSVEGCDKMVYSKGFCNKHYTQQHRASKIPPVIPSDLGTQISQARTTEDWQILAAKIAPVMQGILDGSVKATAAQASLLKDVMNRAYGKPLATQADKKVAAGIVILPVLGETDKVIMCPRCGYDHTSKLESDSIKLSLKALLEAI